MSISHLAQINNFEVMGLKPFELLHRKPPSTSITAVHSCFWLAEEYMYWVIPSYLSCSVKNKNIDSQASKQVN